MGAIHPIVVHFAIAGLLLGAALRWVTLAGRVAFAGPAAAVLVAIGCVAATTAVASGEDARVAAESVPGTAALVREHARWGTRTRDASVAMLVLEAWALRRSRGAAPIAAAVAGLAGSVCVIEAGRHGGALVYEHAAGVGVRGGDPADVGRLLLAGLHHQAALDARAGRSGPALELYELAARRFPDEPGVRLETAGAFLHAHQPAQALALVRGLAVPADERGARFERGWIEAEARAALGDDAGADAVLAALAHEFPESGRLRRRLAERR